MHIAVIASSAPSHIHPHLAVVSELVDRGHRVSYLVGSHLAELAEPTGADVIGHHSVLPGAPGAPDRWPEDDTDGMRFFLDEAIHVLPQVHNAMDGDRPDIVLYDIGGMAGPVAAAHWGVSAAQLSPSAVAWEGYNDDMADVLEPILGSAKGQDYLRTFGEWLAGTGTGLTYEHVTGEPRRCLVLIPRVMQPHAERVGDRYRFVGPCIDPRRNDPGDWTPPPGDGPLALCAFGTAYTDRPDVYRNVIAALDGTGWRLVLSIGHRISREELGSIPDRVQIQPTVPQPAVLPHTDVFITHAGMSSSTEGLWHGVPMVAIPQAVDQPGNAAQLETIGVGRHLADDLPSPAQISDAIAAVTSDPQIRRRLDAIRDELHRDGGPVHAADAVEDVAAGRW